MQLVLLSAAGMSTAILFIKTLLNKYFHIDNMENLTINSKRQNQYQLFSETDSEYFKNVVKDSINYF